MKFLVSLVFVVLVGALLARFQHVLGPLVFAVILAYVLKPVIAWLTTRTQLSWRTAVALTYLALVMLVVVVLTVGGIAIVRQIEGLYRSIVEITAELSPRLESAFRQAITIGPMPLGPFTLGPFTLGPYTLDLATANLDPLSTHLLAAIRSALSQTGAFVGSLASSVASVLGWVLFIIVISYYLLRDLPYLAPSLEQAVPGGYADDARRLAAGLGPIWNAFLRGQITLAVVMGLIVGVAMAFLGVRYALILGLLAGLLEFVPIVGPVIAGTVAVLVALFQPSNWLGLPPVYFALVALAVQVILQQLENNFLVPRIIGGSLNLHPIVILVGAIMAANLAGIVGLLLAAPIMATLRFIGRYVYCKMLDLDPWPGPPTQIAPPLRAEWPRWLKRLL